MNDCPTHNELSQFLTGEIFDDSTRAAIESHVQTCASCEHALSEISESKPKIVTTLQEDASDPYSGEEKLGEALANILALAERPSVFEGDDGKEMLEGAQAPQQGDLKKVGSYEILKQLGHGAMGTVYAARHIYLNRIVALKVLKQGNSQPAIDRFLREMTAIGSVNHPNIVAASDCGIDNGQHFLVMQLIDGLDVSRLVRQVRSLSVADACEIVRQAAIGLQHIHELGMVHRDIKPSNLMLERSPHAPGRNESSGHNELSASALSKGESKPVVRILDLGLALLNDQSADEASQLTDTGQVMGTLDYMAPEQCLDSHNVDIRADVYSLGATLYKLLCGRTPFSGPEFQSFGRKFQAIISDQPEKITAHRDDIPESLVEFVDTVLAKDLDVRPQTPAEVAEALSPFASGHNLTDLIVQRTEISPGAEPTSDWRSDTLLTSEVASSLSDTQSQSQTRLPNFRRPQLWIGSLIACFVVAVIFFSFADYRTSSTTSPATDPAPIPTAPASSPTASTEDSKQHELEPLSKPSPTEILTSQDWVWTVPENLGEPVNTGHHEDSPHLSSDGLSLLFTNISDEGATLRVSKRPTLDDEFGIPEDVAFSIPVGRAWLPSMTADQLQLMFTSDRAGGIGLHDIWVSKRTKVTDPFGPPANLGSVVNSTGADSGTLSNDGLTLVIQSVGHDPDGSSLYLTTRESLTSPFGELVRLNESINSVEFEISPCLSSDDRTLVFSRDTAHSSRVTDLDLWMATRVDTHSAFGLARRLPTPVNNPGFDDSAPSFSRDGQTLYFRSTRPGGVGGGDIWVSRRVPKTTSSSISSTGDLKQEEQVSTPGPTEILTSADWVWTVPKNLGSGVNTVNGEQGPHVLNDGLSLLFSRFHEGRNQLLISTRSSLADEFGTPRDVAFSVDVESAWSPCMTDNRLQMMFTSDRPGGLGAGDIWLSKRTKASDPFGPPVNLGPTLNTQLSDSAFLAGDGLTLVVLSSGHSTDYSSLYLSTRKSHSESFGKLERLNESINSVDFEMAPCLSSDGLTLIFGRDTGGGSRGGEQELWMASRLDADTPFGNASRLPAPVNTPDCDESAPSLSNDGKSLYFHSTRPGGLGNYDIWVSRRVPKVGSSSPIVKRKLIE